MTDSTKTEDPEYDSLPAPSPKPAAISVDSDAVPEEHETLHRITEADSDAAKQRVDDHDERIQSDRIVSAIERAAADAAPKGNGVYAPNSEVLDSKRQTPEDIVQLDQDPESGVYFNPRVDAQTSTQFNQQIFVPDSTTYIARTDREEDSVSSEIQE